MFHFNSLISIVALGFLLGACAPNSPGHSIGERSGNRISVGQIKSDAALSPKEKSEQITEIAEHLANSNSFVAAFAVATEALQVNPTNHKAQLIKAALAPTMELKGLLTRIEPLVKQRPEQYARFVKWSAEIKNMNAEKANRDFLFSATPNINSERDVQELIARYTLRLDELRRTLVQIKDSGEELTLSINKETFQSSPLNASITACAVNETAPMVFDFHDCDLSNGQPYKLNRADLEAMQEMVAGSQIYLTLANGWDLSGAYAKAARLSGVKEKDLQLMLANPEFGRLRENHGFGVIPDLLKDMVIGVRYAQANQESLCAQGKVNRANRPGYVFAQGLCAKSSQKIERLLGSVEQMLQGQVVMIHGAQGEVAVDGLKLFTQPVSDVRDFQPAQFNACGEITQIGNATVGGVLPNGDLNAILMSATSSCPAL